MEMVKQQCPLCMQVTAVHETRKTEYKYKGVPYTIYQPGLWCGGCQEAVLEGNDMLATDAARKEAHQKINRQVLMKECLDKLDEQEQEIEDGLNFVDNSTRRGWREAAEKLKESESSADHANNQYNMTAHLGAASDSIEVILKGKEVDDTQEAQLRSALDVIEDLDAGFKNI